MRTKKIKIFEVFLLTFDSICDKLQEWLESWELFFYEEV